VRAEELLTQVYAGVFERSDPTYEEVVAAFPGQRSRQRRWR